MKKSSMVFIVIVLFSYYCLSQFVVNPYEVGIRQGFRSESVGFTFNYGNANWEITSQYFPLEADSLPVETAAYLRMVFTFTDSSQVTSWKQKNSFYFDNRGI
jgi:hypothetical protein